MEMLGDLLLGMDGSSLGYLQCILVDNDNNGGSIKEEFRHADVTMSRLEMTGFLFAFLSRDFG